MGKLLYTVYAIVVVIFATGFNTPGARMSSGGSGSSWGSSSSGGSGWSSGGSHK